MIDLIYLSLIFLTPGLFFSGLLKSQDNPFLTSSLSLFFWSFSTLIIPLNYLINSSTGNAFLILFLVLWAIEYFSFKNLFFNFALLIFIELLNNHFGILHIVSTHAITLNAALENLTYSSSNIPIPSIQTTFLKFFNESYILASLPQFVGFSLLLGNLSLLIKSKKISKLTVLTILPIFTIFCVFLEIMSIRSHFVASQILCLVLIETFFGKKINENVFIVMLSIFLISRLENIYIYYPMIILIITHYLNKNKDSLNSKFYVKLLAATISPLLINYYPLSGGDDIRFSLGFLICLIGLFNVLIYCKNFSITRFVVDKFNLFFILGIILLGIVNFLLYDFKAIHSWLFLITHLLDTHQGWVLSTILFIILISYLISFEETKENRQIYISIFLTLILILVSSPLQHSLYGGDQWSSGIIDGIPIYNFYDESQTRSFLQLFLTVLPFGGLRIKKSKLKIISKLSNEYRF